MKFFKKKEEVRTAEDIVDSVLKSILVKGDVTRNEAMNIPALAGCVKFIAETVSMLPIKLYSENNGETEEITVDNRLKLLNDETGDLLDANQMKQAFITDTVLCGNGYIFINRERNEVKSLHYVAEKNVSVSINTDPIFKDADINIMGQRYFPFEFIILTQDTENGVTGQGVIQKNNDILSVAYNELVFEQLLTKNGGNKKGFLQSAKKLSTQAMDELKLSWKELYQNNQNNMMVLNDGVTFSESSNTSVEMQLNENKQTNAEQICCMLNLSSSIISGNAGEEEYSNGVKTAILPIVSKLEVALNKSLLLENEKGSKYFAIDITDLMKGDMFKRYQAYKLALDSNFLQIDEVRYKEDLKPLGFNYIKLGLDSVLLDPKTNTIYTANTNQTAQLGEKSAPLPDTPIPDGENDDVV